MQSQRGSEGFPELLDLRLERPGEGGQVRAVHDEVAARPGPGDFLLHTEPVVDAGADIVLSRDPEDGADGLIEARMRVLLGNPQVAGKIVWADQDGIESRNRAD